MFKKAGDNVHYIERRGSHATKGSRRGSVWWNTDDPDAFDRRELQTKKRLLDRQYRSAMIEFKLIIQIHKDAVEKGNIEIARTVRPSMRAFSKNLKNIRAEIAKIKELLKDHPRQLRLRKLKPIDEIKYR